MPGDATNHEPIVGEALAISPVEVAPDHDVRAVLRITPFRRLWLALGLSSFGDWLGLLALASMAQSLAGDSYVDRTNAVAAVFLFRLAPAVLLGPLAGAVADRLNRRFTLVAGDLARFALFLSIPLVGTLPWLFVATVLIECLALFWMPAKDATVPNLVPRNRLEAANQISLVATYGSAPVAAAAFSGLALLSGMLDNALPRLAANPVDLALYVNAATFLVAALTVANLRIPRQRTEERVHHQSVLRTILDGWRFIGTTPLIRGLVLGMLGAFAAAGLVVGLATVLVRDLGAGDPGFGVLFGAVFLGLASGMWGGPRVLRGFSRRRLFGLSIAVAGAFLVAIALVPNMVMTALFTLGLGAAGGIAWVSGYTLLGLEVSDELRGRTFAFLQSAARVVLVIVLPLAPKLAGWIGNRTFVFTDHFALTYSGAAFVFLFAGVFAIGIGFVAFRQMDDHAGVSVWSDLRTATTGGAGLADEEADDGSYPGVFIAVEGGDGAGKSTQAHLLAEWLRSDQGHDVVLTREPGATPLGAQIRRMVLDPEAGIDDRTEALLFAADRSHHVEAVVRPALQRGAIVVTDRYVDSSIAYQSAGRSMDADSIAGLSRWATRGLIPELTIVMDVPAEVAARRRGEDAARDGEDRIEALSAAFHERVRASFLDLARREPHRYLVLSADKPVEALQQAIRARVREIVPISARHRAELARRLEKEAAARERRAEAEAQILRLDASLRAQRHDEERQRLEAQRAARAEAEQQLIAELGPAPVLTDLVEEAPSAGSGPAPEAPDQAEPGPATGRSSGTPVAGEETPAATARGRAAGLGPVLRRGAHRGRPTRPPGGSTPTAPAPETQDREAERAAARAAAQEAAQGPLRGARRPSSRGEHGGSGRGPAQPQDTAPIPLGVVPGAQSPGLGDLLFEELGGQAEAGAPVEYVGAHRAPWSPDDEPPDDEDARVEESLFGAGERAGGSVEPGPVEPAPGEPGPGEPDEEPDAGPDPQR